MKLKRKLFAVTPTSPPTTPAAGGGVKPTGLGGKLKAGFGKIGGIDGAMGIVGTATSIAGMKRASDQMKEQKKQSAEQVSAMNAQTDAINRRTKAIAKSFSLKTKKFAWPLIASLATSAVGMAQQAKQGKEAEKMNAQQLKAQAKATKAQEKQNQLLEEIKNNEELSEAEKQKKAVQLIQKTESEPCSILQREYTVSSMWNTVKTAGKDLYKAGKASGMNDSIKGTLKGCAIATGIGYGVNKLIQRNMKKNKLAVDKQGNLTYAPNEKNGRETTKAYSVMSKPKSNSSIMVRAKKIGGKIGNFGAKALGPALEYGLPTIAEGSRYMQYKAERDQLQNQVDSTKPQRERKPQMTPRIPRQKQFGLGNLIGSIPGRVKTGWNTFKSHPGQSISGAAIKVGSGGPLSMVGLGGFGTKNVQGFAGSLSTSKVGALKRTGDWMQNHKTGANIVMAAPLIYTGAKLGGKVTKLMRKGMKKIDPEAYRYQEAKEARMNQGG